MATHYGHILLLATGMVEAAFRPALPRAPAPLTWEILPTGTKEQLRGLSAVNDKVIWVGGNAGTVLRSIDGGNTWASVTPYQAREPYQEFSSIVATSANHAAILATGDGPLFVTFNGGTSWKEAFSNDLAEAFFEGIAFLTPDRGLALSDPITQGYPTYDGEVIDRKLSLIETADGGKTWKPVNTTGMPAALPYESAYAASGTCMTAGPGGKLYIGTGGSSQARVFQSSDGGYNWNVSATPVLSGNAKGIFSIQFADEKHGIAVGGDYRAQNVTNGTAAWSEDGGITWNLSTAFPGGYRSGCSWFPETNATMAIAVGSRGSDITTDGGKTWRTFDNSSTSSFDGVQCPSRHTCFASGEGGRVARLFIE